MPHLSPPSPSSRWINHYLPRAFAHETDAWPNLQILQDLSIERYKNSADGYFGCPNGQSNGRMASQNRLGRSGRGALVQGARREHPSRLVLDPGW